MLHIVSKFFVVILLAGLVGLIACRYNRSGDSRVDIEPWMPTTTIADLPLGRIFSSPTIVEGVAITSDSAGSFYRELIVEDFSSHNALTIKLGFYDIYATLRPPMVVAVDLRGLSVVDSAGVRMAGFLEADGSVSELGTPDMASRHLRFQGRYEVMRPQLRTIGQITRRDLGHLIRIDSAYFYDGGSNLFRGEQQLKELFSNNSIQLYTSTYASFAGDILPTGIFSISAVVVEFKDKLQLKISDPYSITQRTGKPRANVDAAGIDGTGDEAEVVTFSAIVHRR